MKRLTWLMGSLAIGMGIVAGCTDDDRPITSLPDPGGGAGAKAGSGGSGGAHAGASQGGKSSAGTSNGGSESHAGEPAGGEPGTGGVPSNGGESAGGQGEGGATDAGGAGGAGGAPAEEAPFAGPYTVAFAAPKIGPDIRNTKETAFSAGLLSHWVSSINEVHTLGSAKNLNTGASADVQWGRWADGTTSDPDAIVLNTKQGFHYAIGARSPSLPATGTQEYVLEGSTGVTVGDGSLDVGTVTGSATAVFAAKTKVGLSFSLVIGGVTYVVTTTGGTATPATSELATLDSPNGSWVTGIAIPKPSTGICADGCTVSLMGFFSGADAAHLSFEVHVYDSVGGSPTSVSSVVVLKKKP